MIPMGITLVNRSLVEKPAIFKILDKSNIMRHLCVCVCVCVCVVVSLSRQTVHHHQVSMGIFHIENLGDTFNRSINCFVEGMLANQIDRTLTLVLQSSTLFLFIIYGNFLVGTSHTNELLSLCLKLLTFLTSSWESTDSRRPVRIDTWFPLKFSFNLILFLFSIIISMCCPTS